MSCFKKQFLTCRLKQGIFLQLASLQPFQLSILQRATYNMQLATCNMQLATCNLQLDVRQPLMEDDPTFFSDTKFLAALSSSRSDNVTLFVCLSVTLIFSLSC